MQQPDRHAEFVPSGPSQKRRTSSNSTGTAFRIEEIIVDDFEQSN